MHNPVRIVNPRPGGARFTSEERALRFVARGEAEWRGDAIAFVRGREGEPRSLRAATAGLGSLARPDELRGLPVIGNLRAAYHLQTKVAASAPANPERVRHVERAQEHYRVISQFPSKVRDRIMNDRLLGTRVATARPPARRP